jgi:hypothetical protein
MSIPSAFGMVVRQAQELWSQISWPRTESRDYFLPPQAHSNRGPAGMVRAILLRKGCSDGTFPGNNHDAGIRDDPERPWTSRRSRAGAFPSLDAIS